MPRTVVVCYAQISDQKRSCQRHTRNIRTYHREEMYAAKISSFQIEKDRGFPSRDCGIENGARTEVVNGMITGTSRRAGI